jgi:aryl-alcohol dehydrogenase-like predicted oxidoreductase
MRYRTYAGTGIEVSEVGFGLWTVASGWWGEYSDDAAISLLHRAFDLGITLYDSSNAYGNGRADRLLARAFGDRRNRIVITTKIGYDTRHAERRRGQQEMPRAAGAAHLREAVETSLRRLGTDVIDIMSHHNTTAAHVADDAIWETLERLREEGKLRAWGAALGPSNGYLSEGLDLIRRRRVANLQLIDNILEPFPGQVLTRAAEETGATGLQVRVTHSSGLLEGRYAMDTRFANHDHRRHRPRAWLERGLQKLDSLRFLHEERDMTLGQAALKWLLASPAVATTLPNIYDAAQLQEFAVVSELPDLSAGDLQHIRDLQAVNFGVHETHMRYKGEPPRPGDTVHAPPYRYAGDGYEACTSSKLDRSSPDE